MTHALIERHSVLYSTSEEITSSSDVFVREDNLVLRLVASKDPRISPEHYPLHAYELFRDGTLGAIAIAHRYDDSPDAVRPGYWAEQPIYVGMAGRRAFSEAVKRMLLNGLAKDLGELHCKQRSGRDLPDDLVSRMRIGELAVQPLYLFLDRLSLKSPDSFEGVPDFRVRPPMVAHTIEEEAYAPAVKHLAALELELQRRDIRETDFLLVA